MGKKTRRTYKLLSFIINSSCRIHHINTHLTLVFLNLSSFMFSYEYNTKKIPLPTYSINRLVHHYHHKSLFDCRQLVLSIESSRYNFIEIEIYFSIISDYNCSNNRLFLFYWNSSFGFRWIHISCFFVKREEETKNQVERIAMSNKWDQTYST